MNFSNIMTGVKAAALALVHQAEEEIIGEKKGPERKAWALAAIKKVLVNAGIYGKKIFGVLNLDALIDAALGSLIDWAAAKLKNGFDALEKL